MYISALVPDVVPDGSCECLVDHVFLVARMSLEKSDQMHQVPVASSGQQGAWLAL
jgi:hypothetical protein